MGTVSEIQHRQEVIVWVKSKNEFDYYLADETFFDCFTDVNVKYRCWEADRWRKYDRSENNVYLIPIGDLGEIPQKLKDIFFDLSVFLTNFNIKVVISCGHLSIDKPLPEFPIPFKILCNSSSIDDDRIISMNTFPVKLWNYYGSNYVQYRMFNVLRHIENDVIVDDKEWWDTTEMEISAGVKVTNDWTLWKALMIGQPFIYDGDIDLYNLGFKKYPWMNEKVDKMFVRKNSYYINKHNKENFNKIVKENNNYAIFAKKVFTF